MRPVIAIAYCLVRVSSYGAEGKAKQSPAESLCCGYGTESLGRSRQLEFADQPTRDRTLEVNRGPLNHYVENCLYKHVKKLTKAEERNTQKNNRK